MFRWPAVKGSKDPGNIAFLFIFLLYRSFADAQDDSLKVAQDDSFKGAQDDSLKLPIYRSPALRGEQVVGL